MKIEFFDNDGIPNSYCELEGEKYRVRSEVLILKGDKVYLKKSNVKNQYDRYYKIPGGSVEPDYGVIETSIKEAQEESRINIKNCKELGFITQRYKTIPEWHKRLLWTKGLKYVGCMTYICVAEYQNKYTGYIKPEDQEEEMLHGNWYSINELTKEHREAIRKYYSRKL